jgi:serine/threonine protein kinase
VEGDGEAMNCPGCQQALPENARFCSSCGLSIDLSSSAETRILNPEARLTPDPLIGRILDSKYELIERLGEGGMGTVYRARRLHIGDEVAVKVLNQNFVLESDAIERFRREARSAATIRHTNVVTIHDFSEARADGTPAYIVMEFVRGESLQSLLKREGRLAPERAVSLMQDVCAGVGVAHRQGVVHRDLKPGNIIVVPADIEGERETVKVVDFGVAKLRDATVELRLTQTGTAVGTPYYMSPEQLRGEPLDARADVYSLGAVLYEMLTGAPPFDAASLTGLIWKHLNDPPRALPPQLGVPSALEAVCRRALSKRPEERQADASILRRELQPALAAATAGTQPVNPASGRTTLLIAPPVPPTLRPAPAPQGSNRVGWAIGGLLALLAGAVIIATAVIYIRSFTTRREAGSTSLNRNFNSTSNSDTGSLTDNSAISDQKGDAVQNAESENAPPSTLAQNLTGKWIGTYGPTNGAATLLINEHKGDKLSGVLEQGGVRVAFTGSVDAASRKVTLKETRLLSGSDWSLGENTGEISADGRKMSGTGRDELGAQLGMSYEWSFSKR